MASSYLSRLQTSNRDIYASYKDIKFTFRKFKTLQRRSQRELLEAQDLMNAWQALNQTPMKTSQHINELRQDTNKKQKDLLAKKDEILLAYSDGI